MVERMREREEEWRIIYIYMDEKKNIYIYIQKGGGEEETLLYWY